MELAASMPTRPGDHYRVGVWADIGDPGTFRLLGAANHNRNDPKMETLSKAGTIAGRAWQSKHGEYLCADITKDRHYKARSGAPRPYSAIFAVRLGEPGRPWGVMTVDAPRTDSFGYHELVIIRRFAKLVSAGSSIALAKYAPGSVPIVASPRPARRIVASTVDEPAREDEGGGGSHDGSGRDQEGATER